MYLYFPDTPRNIRAATNNEFQRNVPYLFSSLFFTCNSSDSVASSDKKVDLWWIFSRRCEDFLRCVSKTNSLHEQHNTTAYLCAAWDSKHLTRYVSSSTDTELRFVLLNHCNFRIISSGNSLAVLNECLTWSLMQGSNNRNRMSRNICWEKSGSKIVEIRCAGSYVRV